MRPVMMAFRNRMWFCFAIGVAGICISEVNCLRRVDGVAATSFEPEQGSITNASRTTIDEESFRSSVTPTPLLVADKMTYDESDTTMEYHDPQNSEANISRSARDQVDDELPGSNMTHTPTLDGDNVKFNESDMATGYHEDEDNTWNEPDVTNIARGLVQEEQPRSNITLTPTLNDDKVKHNESDMTTEDHDNEEYTWNKTSITRIALDVVQGELPGSTITQTPIFEGDNMKFNESDMVTGYYDDKEITWNEPDITNIAQGLVQDELPLTITPFAPVFYDDTVMAEEPMMPMQYEYYNNQKYPWNRANTGAEVYLTGFGLDVCNASASTSVVKLGCTFPKTYTCDCDPLCETYGTCCHDRVPDLTVTSPPSGCVHGFWRALVQCPAEWGQDSVRDRCEAGRGRYMDDEPVNDVTTNVTYRNEWCAWCHGVTSVTHWEPRVTCQHFQWLYTALTQRTFMDLAKDMTDVCSVDSLPPEGSAAKACASSPSFPAPVATCNVTGQWADRDYDQHVAAGCERYKSLVLRVFYPDRYPRYYQNLFCAVCNGEPLETGDCSSSGGKSVATPPLSLLLGLAEREGLGETRDLADCLPEQWRDLQNECRQLGCTAGKTLHSDTCITPLTHIRGLAYFLNMSLSMFDPLAISPARLSDLMGALVGPTVDSLTPWTRSFSLTIRMQILLRNGNESVLSGEETEEGQRGDVAVSITGRVTAHRDINRDDAELAITRSFFLHLSSVAINNQDSATLMPQLSATADGARVIASYAAVVGYAQDLDVQNDPQFSSEDLIPLSPLLVCPHVEFNRSEYRLQTAADNRQTAADNRQTTADNRQTVADNRQTTADNRQTAADNRQTAADNRQTVADRKPGVKVTLVFGDVEAELTDVRQSWLVEDRLYVCLAALNSLKRPPAGPVTGELSWQYVLTMVVMPLSMLCLLLTLAVYCVLPSLRSLPGLNTMGTCCALLLAQLSLLLASHRVTSGAWCRALGVLVHVTWLSVFCWTSVCSTHMFRTFSASTRHQSSASSQRRRLTHNILVSILAPAAVVGAVMAGSFLTTDGGNFGYSDVSCYLDGTLLVGLAVVLPASLLLSLNLVLFTLTVRRIHTVTMMNPREGDKQESKRHVYACARLSVLTGATWILSLVAEGLGVDWLQFFSILANGGQGVLLFMSYVTNRRVAAMLAVKLGCRKDIKPSSACTKTATRTGTISKGSSSAPA